ncbi:MAG: hypothetical protein NVS1B11_14890 [Terriglobales bacterium]
MVSAGLVLLWEFAVRADVTDAFEEIYVQMGLGQTYFVKARDLTGPS